MSPQLATAIDAARELAWFPVGNTGRRHVYEQRREAHQDLVDALGRCRRLSANASPQLAALVEAMHRAAAATYSNRYGQPYVTRREAILQLRGCLDEWHRSLTLRAVA